MGGALVTVNAPCPMHCSHLTQFIPVGVSQWQWYIPPVILLMYNHSALSQPTVIFTSIGWGNKERAIHKLSERLGHEGGCWGVWACSVRDTVHWIETTRAPSFTVIEVVESQASFGWSFFWLVCCPLTIIADDDVKDGECEVRFLFQDKFEEEMKMPISYWCNRIIITLLWRLECCCNYVNEHFWSNKCLFWSNHRSKYISNSSNRLRKGTQYYSMKHLQVKHYLNSIQHIHFLLTKQLSGFWNWYCINVIITQL